MAEHLRYLALDLGAERGRGVVSALVMLLISTAAFLSAPGSSAATLAGRAAYAQTGAAPIQAQQTTDLKSVPRQTTKAGPGDHLPSDPNWRAKSARFVALNNQNFKIVKRGDTLVKQGDLDGAIAPYNKALDFKPVACAAPQAHIGLADVFAKKGRYADALTQYNLAKAKDCPGEPFLTHHFFGGNSGVKLKYVIALCRLGKFDEARSAYRQVLIDDPTLLNGTHYVPLDISVTDINYTTRQLETAARLAPGIYYGGDGVRAAAQFEEAIRLRPKFAAAYFYLAMALRDSNLIPESVEARAPTTLDFTTALEKAESLGDDFIRGRAAQESGKRPPMTFIEAKAINERQKSRLPGMLQEVQEGRR